jgi:hypothetical protein
MVSDEVDAKVLCTHGVADAGIFHLDQKLIFAHFIEDDGG